MPTFRYVLCDVFTDRPLEGNQLAVFTDARELDEETMQALALETKLSESVFVLRPSRAGTRGSGSSRRRGSCSSPATRRSAPRSSSAAPLQLDEIRLETGAGIVPVQLEREGPRIVFGRMEQPLPTWTAFRDTAELFAALGVEGAERRSRSTTTASATATCARLARGRWRRCGRTSRAWPRRRDRCVSCFAGDGSEWKTRMFAPNSGVDEDPATGSAAGPLAVHLARHGRIGFGDEIGIEQGAEIGRPSVLYARVDGAGDAVERVAVGGSAVVVARGEFTASTRVRAPTAVDLRQLRRRAPPEAAAVAAEVEAVPGRVEDEVGVVLGDRDRAPAGRPPPASRQVRPASPEMTSGGRRSTTATTVAPDCGRREDERQARLDRPARRPAASCRAEHLLQLEVDEPGAVDGARPRAITARASPPRAPPPGARPPTGSTPSARAST